jgi:hypothetical protein
MLLLLPPALPCPFVGDCNPQRALTLRRRQAFSKVSARWELLSPAEGTVAQVSAAANEGFVCVCVCVCVCVTLDTLPLHLRVWVGA